MTTIDKMLAAAGHSPKADVEPASVRGQRSLADVELDQVLGAALAAQPLADDGDGDGK